MSYQQPFSFFDAKPYTAAFKVRVALEAIKGQRTINEITTHYDVHQNLVTQWKKQAIESLLDIFSTRRERDAQGEEALKAEIYQRIGQLKVELDWLKKSWSARLNRASNRRDSVPMRESAAPR